jgi:PPM family protein phosphatase
VDELLAIGEFAARSGLSAKMLRSYAAAGVLVPAAVDGFSGYRYYAPGQFRQARLILLLRRAGIPLSEIAAFLQNPDPDTLQRWAADLDIEVEDRRQALATARQQIDMTAAGELPATHDGDTPMFTLTAGSATHRGKLRAANQDTLLVSPPLFAVADGMGDSPGGETASRLALDTLKARFQAGQPTADALASAAGEAGRAVWQRADSDPALNGMGTTVTAVAVLDSGSHVRAAVAHVGDSRAYLFQDGDLTQLTHDHSLVQGLIDAGELSAGQWRGHPQRALLTRALGLAPVIGPDLTMQAVAGNARLLLCTDGLTAQADEAQLAAVLSTVADPDQAARDLVRLASHDGGDDDIAVIIINVSAQESEGPGPGLPARTLE